MKLKILVALIILNFFSFYPLLAQERILEGEITVTGLTRKIEGEKAKFNEYRDLRDGIYVGAKTHYERERYFIDFQAEDIGYKTQRYDLSGGKWGSFQYYFNYDETPHNLTYGARSIFSGIGGTNLNYPTHPPSTNISTWNSFDYAVDRKNYGGGFKVEMFKPFFFDVSFFREERKGIYPLAGAGGSSPVQGAVELPLPIDSTTDKFQIEAGYIKNPLALSVSYSYSKFSDDNKFLYFRNPISPTISADTPDYFPLPPNNSDYKLELKGALRLPLNSKFHLRLSSARTESEATLLNYYVLPTSLVTLSMNDNVFNGKKDTQAYEGILTSQPFFFLDAKVFYKYFNTSNKSDQIQFIDGNSIYPNHLFDYRKVRYGGELGIKLPADVYLTIPYSHARIERTGREDIPKNDDDIYGGELKWSGWDYMVAKIGYERWQRRGDFEGLSPASPLDSANIEKYQRRFDVAPRDQDTYKVFLDFFPVEKLNISLGYKYKEANYREKNLGIKSAKRNEFNFDVDYLIGRRVRLFGYFDYEYGKLEQDERTFPYNVANVFDPNNPPTATAYNWTFTYTENNFAFGLGAEIFILVDKLTLNLQYNNFKSDGYADFTYLLGNLPLPGGRTQDNIDIPNYGKYETRNLTVKIMYKPTKSLSFSAGYVFEKFISDEAQFNEYLYYYPTRGATYLTGAYKNLSYEANIAFLTAAIRF